MSVPFFKDIKSMGVINITPNSFSEKNSLLLDSTILKRTLTQFKQISGLIYDFGFESTAPMNKAITEEIERERFDFLFEQISALENCSFNDQWISFDTYRPYNYHYFETQFQSRYKAAGYIFNDVSGVLDASLLDYLESKRESENFYYVLGSTYIPSRDKVLEHMNFVKEGDIVEATSTFFSNGFQKLKAIGMEKKVLFDPCFGFSKSFEQNWDLLNRFPELVSILQKQDIEVPWLIGVSKKSFIRKAIEQRLLDKLPEDFQASGDLFEDAEIIHAQIIKELIQKKCGHLIFRAHDPFLVESVYANSKS